MLGQFPPNTAVLELVQMLVASGDRIAIATARPPERLQETIEWLDRIQRSVMIPNYAQQR